MSRVDDILADREDLQNDTSQEGGTFDLTIDVDDIINAYGSTLMMADIFKQVGTLSFLYKQFIHPVIGEILNGLEDRNNLFRIRENRELADYIVTSLESKVFMFLENRNKSGSLTISSDDIIELCVCVIDLLAGHIAMALDQELRGVADSTVPRTVELVERAEVVCLPSDNNPSLLSISTGYYWVYS